MGKKLGKLLFEFKGFILLIAIMLIFRSSVLDWNSVPTASMTPTIIAGDRVLINKLAYDLRVPFLHWSLIHFKDPDRGEIVVINSKIAKKRLIKRVIAIPGDEVLVKNNRVVVNGETLDIELLYTGYDKIAGYDEVSETNFSQSGDKYSYTVRLYVNQEDISPLKNMSPVIVPEASYFVMGDNRHVSDDSRLNLKMVPRHEIIGRANQVIFSIDYDNYYLPRNNRWFMPLYEE